MGKGRDIGYALAPNSREEADSVGTRTVAALDAITAFAVPNPSCLSQGSRCRLETCQQSNKQWFLLPLFLLLLHGRLHL
jgi:hypothetical protein